VHAAKAHWLISGSTEPALSCLIEALNHKAVGWEAAYILGEMGPSAAIAVPQLITALKTERVPRPFRAAPSSAFALGKIGAPSVQPLITILEHPSDWIRCSAALALGFIGAPAEQATPRLRQLLNDESADVRNAALVGLVRIGVSDQSLVPTLKEMLGAEDIVLRSLAVASLRRIAPERDWEAMSE
jgi:HEAT repeat protein